MELSLLPQPSPTGSPGYPNQVHSIINQLRRHRLGDAFGGLLDLGDQMDGVVDKLHVLINLSQLDRLFAAISRHSAYGIYDAVDHVIHRLLYVAVRTCQALEAAQTSPATNGVGWLSTVQSEVHELLEVCRNFFSYITSHPAGRQSRDRTLGLAQRLLQRTCPRINGLSKWRHVKEGHAKDSDGSATCDLRPSVSVRPLRRRSGRSHVRNRSAPSRHLKRPLPLSMPTPPSQTGDVRCAETIPTLPAHRLGRINVLLPTPDTSYPLFDTLVPGGVLPKASKGLGEDDAIQLLAARPFRTPELVPRMWMGKSSTASRAIDHMAETRIFGFRLRPEHPFLSRCCSFRTPSVRYWTT
ncbi:hypothetical protein N657DRAFT_280441 [Parathielavia appendiculata]|uniref:Uncharacterized protein n=1 Tax=Parathielavia appendiculata TaxID=2587402 RepID=A0AAN6U453_9PEZI|nr:hypothetical protein N657DRAFT_280441 [Parathielavia appendiculata]